MILQNSTATTVSRNKSLLSAAELHLDEWVIESGVSAGIATRSIISLSDRVEIAKAIGWKKYSDEFPPGWLVRGIDLKTMQPQEFCQFKPDDEILLDGKKTKYISDKGHPYDAIALSHPDTEYWQRVLDDVSIPVDIDEGAKKSGCGMTCDFPSLALCGVTMWQRKGELVSNLAALAVPGRTFRIRFDMDVTTKKEVRLEIKKLVKALEQRGCTVLVAMWNPELGLKIDDVKVKHGSEMVKKIMTEAQPYAQWLKSIENQINNIAESRDTSDSKKGKHPSANATALAIAEDYRHRLKFNNTNLCWYRYEGDSPGVWSPETNEYIESAIYQIVKSKGLTDLSPTYVPAVVRFLRNELIERKWESRKDLLPFTNGVLEIATGKLLPHSPGHHFTWTLPRAHCAVASDWQKIEDWLDFATQGNQHVKNLLLAFCNAVLKGRADLQKALQLIGIGGSGKGTLLRLLVALIGIENTHSSTLEDWCNNRFEVAQAYEKRLLLFPDEDKGARQLSKFKQVTGGDWLRAEEKGKKPFKFKFGGMVAVASNFPIFGSDNSSGMARRIIPVPFNAVVAAGNRRDLDSTFESELAAFTNYLLALDDGWVERTLRGVVEIPEINLQGWENKIREDSVAGFLNDRLIYDPLSQTSIGDSAYADGSLYQAYDLYCSDQGHKAQAVKNFSPNLVELASVILGWKVEKCHTRTGKIIKGLRLRTKADEHIPTYDCELHSHCDGFGDGSVTDSVTGQNVYPVKDVTDVTDSSLIQVQKNIKAELEVKQASHSEEITDIQAGIAVNPSHIPEPSPVANPDPSQHPSHYPSQHPSHYQTAANKNRAQKWVNEVREARAKGDREGEERIMKQVAESSLQLRGLFKRSLGEKKDDTQPVVKHSRIFEVGDRVVINDVGGRYHGAKGVIVEIHSYPTRTGLRVKFDKPVSFCQQCEFIAGDLMYLPEK